MSSHHIVREKQEPALLIISLDDIIPENLGQLLEWSPVVIVSDEVYEHADSLGIKIDAVISSGSDFPCQHATRIIEAGENTLQEGLRYLVGEQFPSVNILTNTFSLKEYAALVGKIDLVIYTSGKKIYPVTSGFSKWKVKGEQVQLLQDVINLQVSGLVHLSEHLLETEKDGFYTLIFDQAFIFVAEDI